MSAEWKLLCKILQDGDFLKIKEAQIDKSYFKDSKCIPIWAFVEKHCEDYRKVPDIATTEQKFNVKIESIVEPLDFWIKEVQNQKIEEDIAEIGAQINEKINAADPRAALDLIFNFSRTKALQYAGKVQSIVKAKDLIPVVQQAYSDAKAGKMGIPSPWKTMNDWTMGWFKEDISCIVARSGQGKTFMLLDCAVAATEANYSTLFISCEMSKKDIAQRYFANKFKLNYGGIRKGKLSFFDEQKYNTELTSYNPPHDLEIYDGSSGLHITDVERAIQSTTADFVIIDSCYRIKARQKTKDRFENMSLVFEELKLFAQVYGKAILVSTQLNRDYAKKKGEAADLADIALSDVISWTATNVFSMSKVKDQLQMKIWPVKVREGDGGKDNMLINWDMTIMNFDEVVGGAASTGGSVKLKTASAAAASGAYDDPDDEPDWN